ncbi:MAG: glycerophosphodiester phosphodiesterase [Lachnospiraceae bacterium]|nr:glycerophosphodiester phosphodiesterase [Lachnospiraceae bacterium]
MIGKTLITAHSGADNTAPNSLSFVHRALSSPADTIEVDVRLHKSGLLYLSHDAVDEEESALLSLREVLETIRAGSKRINCDLKEPGLEQAVCALAREAGLSGRLILTGTVSPAFMKESGLLRDAEVYLNIEEMIPGLYPRCLAEPKEIPVAAREMADICHTYGIGCINANHLLATGDFLSVIREEGLSVSVWTVDEAPLFRHFLREKVCNITTRNLSLSEGG